MPSPDERNATTVVIEMKPGWIYVKVGEPKPEPDRIELLLRLTIEHWSHAHPQFVIDKTERVTEHGVIARDSCLVSRHRLPGRAKES